MQRDFKRSIGEFQSSRPVAGARIQVVSMTPWLSQAVSILAPRCRGAHRLGFFTRWQGYRVSILAPRCRGAHLEVFAIGMLAMILFQSSRPVAGARIAAAANGRLLATGFNPRAPLPGRASKGRASSQSKQGVSILAPRCRKNRRRVDLEAEVSILAPRCRGAHPACQPAR